MHFNQNVIARRAADVSSCTRPSLRCHWNQCTKYHLAGWNTEVLFASRMAKRERLIVSSMYLLLEAPGRGLEQQGRETLCRRSTAIWPTAVKPLNISIPSPQLPPYITAALSSVPAVEGKVINQPDLDLLYSALHPEGHCEGLFRVLETEFFFYRVQFKIKRGSIETQINTPRL
jgi:hypothetical protein